MGEIVNFSSAKLIGYIRVNRKLPSIVIPILEVKLEADQVLIGYQFVDSSGMIVGLNELIDFDFKDIRFSEIIEGNIPLIIKEGQPQLHGIQIEGEIIWGTGKGFVEKLRKSLLKGSFSKNPNFALEIAQFIEDPLLEKYYIRKCYKNLQKRSPKVCEQWLKGLKYTPLTIAAILEETSLLDIENELPFSQEQIDHMRSLVIWHEVRVNAISFLWAEGFSTSTIAKTLQGLTRNAVMSKLRRMGIVCEEEAARYNDLAYKELPLDGDEKLLFSKSEIDYIQSHPGWSEVRVNALSLLWHRGFSASSIARILGAGVRRNAVIGKAHKLGLSGRAKPGEGNRNSSD